MEGLNFTDIQHLRVRRDSGGCRGVEEREKLRPKFLITCRRSDGRRGWSTSSCTAPYQAPVGTEGMAQGRGGGYHKPEQRTTRQKIVEVSVCIGGYLVGYTSSLCGHSNAQPKRRAHVGGGRRRGESPAAAPQPPGTPQTLPPGAGQSVPSDGSCIWLLPVCFSPGVPVSSPLPQV